MKKQYSEPAIYDCGGDISKRWYVYFYFRNPETAKLERQPSISVGLNKHKNLRDRRAAAKILRESLSEILANGYNPYTDENAHYSIEEVRKLTVEEAVEFVLQLKKSEYGSGYVDFKSRLNQFKAWLHKHGFQDRMITDVSKTVVINYLNFVLKKNSPANRNNTRSRLSVFFQMLEDNQIIPLNFMDRINVLKATPERNKSYTTTQESEIFAHLEKKDPVLLLYIKFVSYNFLRPIEVNRLHVGDIDLVDKRIYVRAKNKPVKIKILPDILIQELPDLSRMNPDHLLFGMVGIGEKWETELVNRRGFYSDRFKKMVKIPFNLGINYGFYSFRHTFIAKLYNALLIGSTPFEAKSRLMLITGHTTMSALEKYLRDIDAELPDDYSHLIKK
jgi:integrase